MKKNQSGHTFLIYMLALWVRGEPMSDPTLIMLNYANGVRLTSMWAKFSNRFALGDVRQAPIEEIESLVRKELRVPFIGANQR